MRTPSRYGKSSVATLSGVMLFCTGLLACSEIPAQATQVIQAEQGREESHATAESYYRQAEVEREQAAKYERRADSLGPYEDTKGFVRSGLRAAASTHRAKARDLEQRADLLGGDSGMASR